MLVSCFKYFFDTATFVYPYYHKHPSLSNFVSAKYCCSFLTDLLCSSKYLLCLCHPPTWNSSLTFIDLQILIRSPRSPVLSWHTLPLASSGSAIDLQFLGNTILPPTIKPLFILCFFPGTLVPTHGPFPQYLVIFYILVPTSLLHGNV